MRSSIVDGIKSLPPLSKTVSDINRVYGDEESGINDLVKVIENDPMVVANLLKLANSPLYNFGNEIKSIEQAVSRFGMSMTRSLAIGMSVRKLLNVDMQPYGITSDKFAEVSLLQANLVMKWYKHIDLKKAEELYLAAFLQEVGKILIANSIIQDDETISFSSEITNSSNIAMVEKSYVGVTSAEVTAEVFEFWKFDKKFIEMIKYSDTPSKAPDEVREYSTALNIIKTIVPLNKPLSEQAINFGLRKAHDAGYDHELLEDEIDKFLEHI
ncbi:MAG: HDOD domain-containing protein [Campylobacterales bacterium]|nr:HDOD domain-containing protein [Campylobacterales bacterium]